MYSDTPSFVRPFTPPREVQLKFFPLPRYASESDLLRELFCYPHRMFSELLWGVVASLLRGCWEARLSWLAWTDSAAAPRRTAEG